MKKRNQKSKEIGERDIIPMNYCSRVARIIKAMPFFIRVLYKIATFVSFLRKENWLRNRRAVPWIFLPLSLQENILIAYTKALKKNVFSIKTKHKRTHVTVSRLYIKQNIQSRAQRS